MAHTLSQAFMKNLLGQSPGWYKMTILAFLVLNPILMVTVGPFITGWVLIGEFIFTLAMALKCYPLPSGGLLAIEAVILGMTSPATVYEETVHNFPVILLLMFMVAGIYFMKDMLQFTFTKILIKIKSKILLSLLFCFAGAFLSAFLDALTVTAVIISVAYGFYSVYHKFASGGGGGSLVDDSSLREDVIQDLAQFRGFLRNLMMHGAVGTALGGVCTLVGEPQNLLIGHEMGWHFIDFLIVVAPVSLPVFVVGHLTCVLVEKLHIFGYGYQLPDSVRTILEEEDRKKTENMTLNQKAALIIQAIAAVYLVVALALHLAEVGIIGLSIIVLLTAFCGITEEHRVGHAFEEALPFTALLVVFFAIVAVIHDQHLFAGIIHFVLEEFQGKVQMAAYYLANGILSMISDNVFVATVYITETKMHFLKELAAIPGVVDAKALMAQLTDAHNYRSDILATLAPDVAKNVGDMMHHFDKLAVSINTGTNIPSVATPNGQAAFLFLLTSALAPVIRLSYGRMVILALPYTITMTLAGLAATWFLL